jgi:hypothetical protein
VLSAARAFELSDLVRDSPKSSADLATGHMNLKARLAAAEARLRKLRGPLVCIMIKGGLEPKDGQQNFARIGDLLCRREADETVDAFQHRVREAAIASVSVSLFSPAKCLIGSKRSA